MFLANPEVCSDRKAFVTQEACLYAYGTMTVVQKEEEDFPAIED